MTTGIMAGDWAGLRVLVTGCTGFIGSRLARLLVDRGATVIGLVRGQAREPDGFRIAGLEAEVTLHRGRIEEARFVDEVVAETTPDLVFHLAGQSKVGLASRDPRGAFEANVQGTWNLLDAVRRSAPRAAFVAASSDAVYADAGGGLLDEHSPQSDAGVYETTRQLAERICLRYASEYGLEVGIVRSSNAYGGGDVDLGRIVPSAVHALLRGRRPVIRGTGQEVRDFVHVDDLARGFASIGDALRRRPELRGQTFNFSSGRSYSVLAVVETAARVVNRPDLPPEVLAGAPASIGQKLVSSKKAHDLLGWKAEMDLSRGLEETVFWHQRHWPSPSDITHP